MKLFILNIIQFILCRPPLAHGKTFYAYIVTNSSEHDSLLYVGDYRTTTDYFIMWADNKRKQIEKETGRPATIENCAII